MGRIELARATAKRAPAGYPFAAGVYLANPGVDVAVAEVGVALGVPGDIGGLVEDVVPMHRDRPARIIILRDIHIHTHAR